MHLARARSRHRPGLPSSFSSQRPGIRAFCSGTCRCSPNIQSGYGSSRCEVPRPRRGRGWSGIEQTRLILDRMTRSRLHGKRRNRMAPTGRYRPIQAIKKRPPPRPRSEDLAAAIKKLSAKAEFLDQRPISIDVLVSQVVEKSTTLTHNLKQTSA